MLILISDAFNDHLAQALTRYGEVTTDKARLPEATVVLIRSKTKVDKQYLDSATKLKMVIRGGVGLDNVDVDYARSKHVIVYNTAEASTIAVAELAFALMIALPNHLVVADKSMREGKWIKSELHRTELSGKVLGILGMGRIGTALALRARAFRMKVLAWHPDVYFSDFAEIKHTLEETLESSDFVSMHVPLVESTKGLINKKSLAHFKTGAYLINTGRGQCIVEEDVVEALKSGKLGGYATDVWYSDPPQNSPLIGAPNCIFTPHVGAETKENMNRIAHIVERLIADHMAQLT